MRPNERCEALFASLMSSDAEPDHRDVAEAICWAMGHYDGVGGCAAEMAAAYGKDPESAAARMRWARHIVLSLSEV